MEALRLGAFIVGAAAIPACAANEPPPVVAQIEISTSASSRPTQATASGAPEIAPAEETTADEPVADEPCDALCPNRVRCIITAHVTSAEVAAAPPAGVDGDATRELIRIAGPARTTSACSDESGSGVTCPAGTNVTRFTMQLSDHVARWRIACVIVDPATP